MGEKFPQFLNYQFEDGERNNEIDYKYDDLGYDDSNSSDHRSIFMDNNRTIFGKNKKFEENHLNLSFNLEPIPSELTEISAAGWAWIITYIAVFILASVGNLLEFFAVWRRIRIRYTPMNVLLLNLCVADILVVVFVVAVEIAWRISIGWQAGRVMCKFLQFCRAFSLYLSSFVVICLTLDRFYAVLFPLKVVSASKRVKGLLITAWVFAAFLAVPQCIVFDVKSHPDYPSFTQCATEGDMLEEANTILSICFMYFLPILVILFSYGSIIYRLKMENDEPSPLTSTGRLSLRRSDKTLMDRAKTRALKLTCTITFAFIFCWSPYILISTWHVVDRTSAEKVHPNIQEGLFIMVVANSCANPLVYGVFHSGTRKEGHGGRRDNSGNGPTPSAALTMITNIKRSTRGTKGHRLEITAVGAPPPLSPMVQIQSVSILEGNYNRASGRGCGSSKVKKTQNPFTTNKCTNGRDSIEIVITDEGKIETTLI